MVVAMSVAISSVPAVSEVVVPCCGSVWLISSIAAAPSPIRFSRMAPPRARLRRAPGAAGRTRNGELLGAVQILRFHPVDQGGDEQSLSLDRVRGHGPGPQPVALCDSVLQRRTVGLGSNEEVGGEDRVGSVAGGRAVREAPVPGGPPRGA